MARNAVDAARSTRPKGEKFSVSLCMFHGEVLVTNRTGWKSRTREFNPPVSLIKISILKNFHEMFGLTRTLHPPRWLHALQNAARFG
jgi:hypothetical protein